MSNEQQFTPSTPLNTPVLFLVFSRLDTTKQVFQAIRKAKPPRIYISADGARKNKEGEAEKVKSVRDYILENIDWNCEVKTLFREKNLGCKYAVNSGIKWFFENEEQGIILEDDTIPNQDFFKIMEACLAKYKGNKNISSIGGRNELSNDEHFKNEPFLTDKFWVWGWASWKDRIEDLDVEMGYDNSYKPKFLISNIFDFFYVKYLISTMESGLVNTWDWPYDLGFRAKGMKSLIMPVNLVENVGFGLDATHSTELRADNVYVKNISNGIFLPENPTYDKGFIKRFMLKKMNGSRVKLTIVLLFNYNKQSKYIFKVINNIKKRIFK